MGVGHWIGHMDDESGVGRVVCIKPHDFGETNRNANYLSVVEALSLAQFWSIRPDYELGGGLTDTVPYVSIGSHFGPPPPWRASKQLSWILSSASLLAASTGFPCLGDQS